MILDDNLVGVVLHEVLSTRKVLLILCFGTLGVIRLVL